MKNTIVLFFPAIPHNTGNIARLCAVTGTRLHLVGDIGFSLEDKYVRRAGLDYWQHLDVVHEKNVTTYLDCLPLSSSYLFSTKASRIHTTMRGSGGGIYLCFGNEISGTPEHIARFFRNEDRVLRIPMIKNRRCLNLAVSAGIGLYEALRQQNFAEMF